MVMCFEVLEHQTAPRDFFVSLRSAVAADGLLVLSTCLSDGNQHSAWGYLALAGGQHIAFASAKGMQALAEHASMTWLATGVNVENNDLQVHIFSPTPRDHHEVISVLQESGFIAVPRGA